MNGSDPTMSTLSPQSAPAKGATYPLSSHFATMPRLRHHRSPKRKKCMYIETDVESEGSGLDTFDASGDATCALHWKVDDVAAQLTLLNHAVFRELLPLDLASLKWYDPRMKNYPESQRVNAITTRFNYDGQWAISEILKQETPRQRAEMWSHFIRIADRLFQLNNFHTSYAIFSALLSSPIARLHQTQALLPKRDKETCDFLAAKFSSDNNWKAFREYQEGAGYPRLPHIGFYKTDLIHAYHAYTNVNERRKRLKAIEQKIFDLFSRSNYGFLEEIPALQSFLKSLRYLEELQKFVDEGNIKLSKTLEPDPNERVLEHSPSCNGSRPLTVRDVLLGSPMDIPNTKTNLIDDSNIEDLIADDAFLLSSGHMLSRNNIGNLSLPSNMAVLQRHYDWQGMLEKKTIVKNGQFRFLPRWKSVWAAAWGSNYFIFKPKSPFRTGERVHFEGIPCTVYTVTDWKLHIGTDETLSFKLQSPDNAFIVRFKTRTVTEYREWIKFLKAATGAPSNLINLDG
ncbi:LOW QUALITY PROTEIN: ras-specific guanine nucleotide-releasing factor RalGPS1-like [Paramacrobiotus metropolitanus]|uniref:LOW QUALITY PROTEIN: ras-specific guanine nucleotide-releasing factor RalGPS1-like n=1 Tax=Paramacrobiotus metropolitanus TaxID=2943436 RepID=UPI002445A9FB|nr:LOW QUALITY PROTEIN: ras-specific guanine nucleotide-releasing factor RalGPS1-like [Paramacrobiotus metropolitanus]